MRMSLNNAKVPGAKHNDRNYDAENDDHIDSTRTKNNYTNQCKKEAKSFDENERLIYEEYFRPWLDAQNEKYTKKRQYGYVKTMDDIRHSKQYCPDETIFQIGDRKHHDQVDQKLLKKIMNEYMKWHAEKYPKCKMLDLAIHMDESTPHVHIRKVWVGHDKDGNMKPSMNLAMKEMGIDAPFPNEKISKWNNPKITYTATCRQKLQEICKSHGLELQTEPEKQSRTAMKMAEYKLIKEIEELQKQKAERQTEIDKSLEDKMALLKEYQTKIETAEKEYQKTRKAVKKCDDELKHQQAEIKALETAKNGIEEAKELAEDGLEIIQAENYQAQQVKNELQGIIAGMLAGVKALSSETQVAMEEFQEYKNQKTGLDEYAKAKHELAEMRRTLDQNPALKKEFYKALDRKNNLAKEIQANKFKLKSAVKNAENFLER